MLLLPKKLAKVEPVSQVKSQVFVVIKSRVLEVRCSPSFRVISYEEGKALAESWNAAFLESSAKENQVLFFIIMIVLRCR